MARPGGRDLFDLTRSGGASDAARPEANLDGPSARRFLEIARRDGVNRARSAELCARSGGELSRSHGVARKVFQHFAQVLCQRFVEVPSNRDLINLAVLRPRLL